MTKPTQKPSPTIATLHHSHTLTCITDTCSSPFFQCLQIITSPQKAVESRPGIFKVSFPHSVKRQDYPGPKIGKSWDLRTAHSPGFYIHEVCSEVMEAEKRVCLERVFMLKESRGKKGSRRMSIPRSAVRGAGGMCVPVHGTNTPQAFFRTLLKVKRVLGNSCPPHATEEVRAKNWRK